MRATGSIGSANAHGRTNLSASAVDPRPRAAGGRISRISRRRLLRCVGTLGVALTAGCAPGPFTVVPPTPRLRRIGVLIQSDPARQSFELLGRGLGELGYVEGRDFAFKGANPGDLPVEENTIFDIVLNRSMARKIGVTFPESVLRRATEVIDTP